jgi:CMP-N,N'-diacetyllegionaminic acid synthase
MKLTAIILARAGSKGLPGKNMLPVAGKPCAAWTLEHAFASSCVARVVVSTDDPALAILAREMGAIVVPRPAELASDTATIDDAARHCVRAINSTDDAFAILYANVPVRPPDLTDRACALLDQHTDSLQSFSPVGKHHPWWMVRIDPASHSLAPWQDPEHGLFHSVYRRQALPPAFAPDGGVMVVSRRALMLECPDIPHGPHAFLGHPSRRKAVITCGPDELGVIDIDSRVDLLVADAVLRERAALQASMTATPPESARVHR